ncbi:PD-(D/E)XK nuclease-like domain-containing protein, partial [Citrobacter freundii]|uniref:PD-(D/E)XK nuclease-like domain-containing protein n=1 Tax=Citrobacter freundii TaxID=546 RepID=UPI00383BCCE3
QPQLTVVATMPLRHRILAQFLGNGEYLYHVDVEQKAEILRLEMDTENARVQNMMLAAENVEPFKKAIDIDIHRAVKAYKTVFPADQKSPDIPTAKRFFEEFFATDYINRGLLVKEWIESLGNHQGADNVSTEINPVTTTIRREYKQTWKTLDEEMAIAFWPGDVEPGKVEGSILRWAKTEIIGKDREDWKRFSAAMRKQKDALRYDCQTIFGLIRERPDDIHKEPTALNQYIDEYLATRGKFEGDLPEKVHALPQTRIMSEEGKSDDEEKSQSSVVLADEQAAPETVEPDTTEHHQDTQPLDAESQVDTVDAGYQKIRAELHEARVNIPPKNPVDVDKQLAAARSEYVEGISDPNDPKWLHDNYSASASNEVEKTEVQTENDEETPKETAGDSVQEDNEGAQSDAGCDSTGDASDTVASVSTVPDDIKPGIYLDIPNEMYHSGPGVSKSQLDDIADTPAFYLWRKNAPVDPEKTKTLDMGTAFHCRVLEPEEFDKRFIVAPEFNRRTNAGKEEERAFLEKCASTGKTIITAEEGRKIELMYQSVMALPLGQWLVESAGYCESSIYWEDSETGILCRCRPDKIIPEYHWIMDVKTTADIHRFKTAYYDYRYHVQDAFYSDGYQAQFGEQPTW